MLTTSNLEAVRSYWNDSKINHILLELLRHAHKHVLSYGFPTEFSWKLVTNAKKLAMHLFDWRTCWSVNWCSYNYLFYLKPFISLSYPLRYYYNTVVFTADQTTAFFTDAGELAITVETRDQLISEGLEDVADLVEFDDNSLKQITHNFRLLEGRILDPNTGAPDGTTITMPFFLFGRKSQLRLKTAITISKY